MIEELTGYSVAELQALSPADTIALLHPEDQHLLRELLAAATAGGSKTFQFKYRFLHKDGTYHWISDTGAIECDAAGQPHFIHGVLRDVSVSTQTEAELRESQRQLQLALAGAASGIWNYDARTGEIQRYSVLADVLGYPPGELGNSVEGWLRLIHPDDAGTVQAAWSAHLDGTTEQYCTEHRLRTAAGNYIWVLDSGRVVERDEQGAPLRLVGTHKDITEQKLMEAALREQQARYAALVNTTQDGFWLIDQQGRLREVNDVYCKMSGYRRDELLGKAIAELDLDTMPIGLMNRFSQLQEDGSWRFEAQQRRVDGTSLDLDINVTAIKEQGLWIAFVADVSEQKRAARLQKARLNLLELAETTSVDELLIATLDELEVLTGSKIGFFHFLDEEQQMLTLQVWSTQTSQRFCTAVGKGEHYPVVRAGVWVDCIRLRQPVIHNDYVALPHKRGLPVGHAEVVREAVVPIFRSGKIVALAGVGNKPVNYQQQDTDTIALFADLAWDIAERKRAEHELSVSEEKFRNISEQSSSLIALTDQSGVITYASPAANTIFHCKPEAMVGRHFVEFLDETSQPVALAAFRDSIAHETQYRDLELLMRRPDGSTFYGELQASVATVAASHGTLVTIRDVTARKMADAERAKLEEQVRQAQKIEALGTLAGGIAHDFNNLLFAISGNAELALQLLDPASQEYENIASLLKASTRAKDLVQQILAFSRKSEARVEPLDISTVLTETLQLLRRVIPSSIELCQQVEPTPGTVMADSTEIQQVLMNILMNAAQAIEPAAGTIKVALSELELRAGEQLPPPLRPGVYLRLSIIDTGCGIPPEVLPKVFDPYFTTKDKGRGTGLGLAVAHGIVTRLGGAIQLDSTPQKGTCVTILLPVVGGQRPTPARSNSSLPPLSAHVLVVDDEDDNLAIMQQMLQHIGCSASCCTSPDAALQLLEHGAQEIQAVITDQSMPHTSGLMLARMIRDLYPALPVILYSGYGDTIDSQALEQAGISQLLAKPVSLSTLANALAQVLKPLAAAGAAHN